MAAAPGRGSDRRVRSTLATSPARAGCQQDHQTEISETPPQQNAENEQRNGEHFDSQRPHHADDLRIDQQCVSQNLDGLIGGRRANRGARCIEDQYEDAEGKQDGGVDAKDARCNETRGIEPIRIRPARQRLQQDETADDEKQIDRRGSVTEDRQKVRRPSAIDVLGRRVKERRDAARRIAPRRPPHMRSYDRKRGQAAQSLQAGKEFIFPACWYWR
jgi:hypothetical protein